MKNKSNEEVHVDIGSLGEYYLISQILLSQIQVTHLSAE